MRVPVKLYFPKELYDRIPEAKRDGETFSDTVFRLLEEALSGAKKKKSK